MRMRIVGVFVATFIAMGGGASAQSTFPIAGLTPDQRPAGAPVIKDFQRDKSAEAKNFQGISKPYPPGLPVVDQGAWFTPFNRPGMPQPYDIREWHKNKGRNQ